LCAINPCAIRGPGALDREGNFVRPVGTGPFRFVGTEGDRVLRLARHAPGAPGHGARLDLWRLPKGPGHDPVDALLRGEADVAIGSWLLRLDPERIGELRKDPRFEVFEGPGSSVHYLSFRLHDGPTADPAIRRRIAAAVDRRALIELAEAGHADPCTAWAAPSVTVWPQRPAGAAGGSAAGEKDPAAGSRATAGALRAALHRPLRLVLGPGDGGRRELAACLKRQLGRAGLPTDVVEMAEADAHARAVRAGEYDLRLEVTWGVPYDPYLSLVARFAPPPEGPTAASVRAYGVDERLVPLVRTAMATPGEDERIAVYREIQDLMDREALLVPLFAPRRVAVLRAGLPDPRLDHDIYRTDLTFLTDRP
jgi:peptide/nickel transport system substrate-binding protein